MAIDKKYYTVTDKETVNLLIQHINESDVIAYDTETNSLNMRKGKIIGFSVSGDVGIGFYLPTMKWNTETESLDELEIEGIGCHSIAKKIISMLIGKKLVMHNASFDCRFTTNFYGVNLLPSLWVETQLLVHTVQEEGTGMGVFGLKPLAISIQDHIGLDVAEAANKEQVELKESIVGNGGQVTRANYEIYKADMDILSKYAAADTDLTLRVCYHFLGRLKEEGLEKFFFEEEVMPLYREVTIPMEEYGVDLDIELISETREAIIKDLEENKKIVMDSLLALEGGRSWVIDHSLKEFPPKNKGSYAQRLCELKSADLVRTGKLNKFSFTVKAIEAMEDSPLKEFLQTNDLTCLDEKDVVRVSMSLWKEKNDNEYINIQSKKHLGAIAFDYLGIKPMTQTRKGQDQFDMDLLGHLAKEHPWAENLRIYNKLLKIKSAYVDRFYDGHEDGRYYFYYKQNGTVSGRYGSDAQQLPKPKEEGEDVPIIVHYNNLVRSFLIAGEGRKVIDADYESLEPHCFASVSGDKGLQDIFNNGWDFYSTVAIKTEKLEEDKIRYPDGVSPDKKSPVFLKKIDPVKRNKAKAYSLGLAYGMEAYALAMGLFSNKDNARAVKAANKEDKDKTPAVGPNNRPNQAAITEAKALIEGYFTGFPNLKTWKESSREQVKNHGYIVNKVGRIRHLPKVKAIHEKFGDDILDWRFRKGLETTVRPRMDKKTGKTISPKDQLLQVYRDYLNGLNNCLNYQLQSLAAAVVNRAAVQINRKLKEMGVDGRVQAQVHDQLIINVPEHEAERVAPIVQEIMENTTKLEGVTLKAPPEISDNWKEGH